MSSEQTIIVERGLPAGHHRQVAELYYDAFQQKFAPIFRDRAKGVAVLEKSLNAPFAMVARRGDELLGVAGFQYAEKSFLTFAFPTFHHVFGLLPGALKYLTFGLFARPQRAGELLMDGIVVHPAARGQGVGTLLLHALFDIAQQQQMRTIRLDVVDTNPAARRLYERLGFVAVKTHRYPLLRTIFGFSASTTMIAQVNHLEPYRQPIHSPPA